MGLIEQERVYIHLLMQILNNCKTIIFNKIFKINNAVMALVYEFAGKYICGLR
jgi:hypothetical protein